jgi:hypothetical protein
MRIAITDACIFIDLHELKLTNHLFSLELDIHTSLDVFNELYPHQQDVLSAFHSAGKLNIHNISEEDRINMQRQNYPKSLSENDKTVLFLAEKIDAMVLSSDKVIRNCAKKKSIEYHGMLWIFDRITENGSLSLLDASAKLKILMQTNIIYQNNAELIMEMEKRLKLWHNTTH